MKGYAFLKAAVAALMFGGSSSARTRSFPSFLALATISSRFVRNIYPLASASCFAFCIAGLGEAAKAQGLRNQETNSNSAACDLKRGTFISHLPKWNPRWALQQSPG